MQMTRHQSAGCALFALASLLAGCAAPPSAPPPPAPPPSAVAATNAAAMAAHPQSFALSIDGYKRDVARHIYRNRPDEQFDGAPPPMLRSVVVLTIRIDSVGNPVHVAVVRSNGYHELEEVAIRSVKSTAPLPMPNRLVARNGSAEYFETWLFRDDGRYQIRSLAEPQSIAEQ